MKLLFVFSIILLVSYAEHDPDFDRNFSQLLNSRGIAFEQHEVLTDDGYFLTLFRAPRLLTEPVPTKAKPVILLIHGLLDQSDTWIYNDPQNSLGTILPWLGYDVWFANQRGVHWSQKHVTEDSKFYNAKYWNFTIDHFAKYDLVSNVNKILEVTGQKSLTIIGHSQGSAQSFAALSDPEISLKVEDKINLLIALAPAYYVSNVKSKVFKACLSVDCQKLFMDIHVYGIFDNLQDIAPIVAPICNYIEIICWGFDKIIADEDPHAENWPRIDDLLAHEPGATSAFNLNHWSQVVSKGQLMKYDFGSAAKNRIAYGTDEPPKYDIKNFKTPVALFAGLEDIIVSVEDCRHLRDDFLSSAPSPLIFYKEVETFGHLSFVWGNDCYEKYHPELFNILRKMVPAEKDIEKALDTYYTQLKVKLP